MFNSYHSAIGSLALPAQPSRRPLYLLLLGYLLLGLAGCKPVTLAAEPLAEKTSLPQDVFVLPSVTPTNAADQPIAENAALPSPTVALVLLVPTNTPTSKPLVRALNSINIRSGPATDYPVVSALELNAQAAIFGKNLDASWWQIGLADGSTGWVYASLVETSGDVTSVAMAVNIPPPPTATPTSVPIVQVENPVVQPETPPTPAQALTEPVPAETEQPAPVTNAPTFRVIEKRLWDVYENGGTLDGDSVKCGEKRQLQVIVVDPNGIRLNGVAVQVQYGAKEIYVTGDQGKGDGVAEFILGGGQDVTIIGDGEGRAATSEMATGLVTAPDVIAFEQLIAGHYCTDAASCTSFVATRGCWGHFSWTVIFQRGY